MDEAQFAPPMNSEPKDIHHDAYLTSISAELISLVDLIFEQAEELQQKGAIRKPRKGVLVRRKATVRNIIANLAALHDLGSHGGSVILSMGQLKRTRYDRPEFHNKLLREQLNLLETLGWLHRKGYVYKKLRTTIKPSIKLTDKLDALKIGPHVGRDEGGETIIMRAKSLDQRTKVPLDYDDTDETNALRAIMDELNESIKHADIRYDGKKIGWSFLVRNFQCDASERPLSFDRVGRLSGGFWMSLEKSKRGLITMDGEPLVDLDYRSSFVSLAYHMAELEQPLGDPYLDFGEVSRADAKLGLLALLCRSGPMLRLPDDLAHLNLCGWSGLKFEAAMRERHQGIAHLFGKDLGLNFMYQESQVLVAALLDLARRNIPALGMHDGMMVGASKAPQAFMAMQKASENVLGVTLKVVSKPIAGRHIHLTSH